MQISGATKKQHDSPRLNRHAAFLFIIFFQAVYIVCTSLHFTFCTVQPNIAGEPPSPPNLSFFSKDTSPLLGGCKRPGFPIQMLFTSFLRIPLVIYFMFFCMQDAVPTRPKQACISVDKYNMQDFFWNVLFFLRKFFNFFCELFHRKFSILFIAYTFECYMQI